MFLFPLQIFFFFDTFCLVVWPHLWSIWIGILLSSDCKSSTILAAINASYLTEVSDTSISWLLKELWFFNFSYKCKFVFLQWLTIWLDRALHYIQNIVLLISFMMILMAIEMSKICWKLTYYMNELVNNYLLDFNFIWGILFVWDIRFKDSWNRVVLSSIFQIIFIKMQLEQTFLANYVPNLPR